MKVLLYFEGENVIARSGIGRAFRHQQEALKSAGIEFTTDPLDPDYDILHINTYYMNSDTMIRHAREHGKKVIYHAHSTEEDFRNSFTFSNVLAPMVKMWLVHLYTQADALITPTPYAKGILESYGITKPVFPVSNGIDLKQYERDEEKVIAYRRHFGIKEEDKVVLGVGLYFQRKGILDFVETAKKLPEYKFIWFGDTNRLIIPHEITAVIENHPDNVYFPGYVKGPIIEGAYSDADCFFFPSYEETEGIVVLEALASHTQVIVRDIGAFHPWLEHGKNCYMAADSEGFASLIEDCVEHRLPSTACAGYETACQRSIESIGKQLKEVYEYVLNQDD